MTEGEWLSSSDPMPLLEYVLSFASDRKLRLLAVSCLREAWNQLGDVRSRRAIEMLELFADGQITASEFALFESDAYDVRDELWDSGNRDDMVAYAEAAAWVSTQQTWNRLRAQPVRIENYPFGNPQTIHCVQIREHFGNPFCIIFLEPSRLSAAVRDLTESIYVNKSLVSLPVLADALEETGCDDLSILEHCRNGKNHARGCWVIDTILGWR